MLNLNNPSQHIQPPLVISKSLCQSLFAVVSDSDTRRLHSRATTTPSILPLSIFVFANDLRAAAKILARNSKQVSLLAGYELVGASVGRTSTFLPKILVEIPKSFRLLLTNQNSDSCRISFKMTSSRYVTS